MPEFHVKRGDLLPFPPNIPQNRYKLDSFFSLLINCETIGHHATTQKIEHCDESDRASRVREEPFPQIWEMLLEDRIV